MNPPDIEDARLAGAPDVAGQPAPASMPARRPDARMMWRSPLHLMALGVGSGLSPVAPGTVGTLWAWLSHLVLSQWWGPWQWGLALALGLPLGVWACTHTARSLGTHDPGAVVWDEILAFWLILWVISPASLGLQAAAFVLFRFFDAVKPGPVGWADRRFKGRPGQAPGWAQGFGIVLDDLVAALCSLLVLALWLGGPGRWWM